MIQVQQGARKQPPRWHRIELKQMGRLLQHPRCDMHCHGTSTALIALNLCQLPSEPSISRPASDRCVIRFGKAWDPTPALPYHLPPTSIHFPCCWLMSAQKLPWGGNNSWFSPNHLTQLKKNLQSMLTCFYCWQGTRRVRSDFTLPRLCWLYKIPEKSQLNKKVPLAAHHFSEQSQACKC